MSNPANGSSPTQERSVVRNTLEKEKSQGMGGPLPHEVIREFYDKHYDQLLPLMAEKVHYEKLRQVTTRLNFNNEVPRSARSQEQSRKWFVIGIMSVLQWLRNKNREKVYKFRNKIKGKWKRYLKAFGKVNYLSRHFMLTLLTFWLQFSLLHRV